MRITSGENIMTEAARGTMIKDEYLTESLNIFSTPSSRTVEKVGRREEPIEDATIPKADERDIAA